MRTSCSTSSASRPWSARQWVSTRLRTRAPKRASSTSMGSAARRLAICTTEAVAGGAAALSDAGALALLARPGARASVLMRGCSSGNVVLQLLDLVLLVGDDRLDQVADRQHAHHGAVLQHRQVADAVAGH